MSHTIWQYNGKEFEFDIADADTQERLYSARSMIQKALQDIPKTGPEYQLIREQHKIYIDFFNALFGSNRGKDILGEKANARLCVEAFTSFAEFCSEQNEENTRYLEKVQRYTPNRAQRRAAK